MRKKYFKWKTDPPFNNKWVFHGQINGKGQIDIELLQLKWFKKSEHVMIRNLANTDDRDYVEYKVV